MIKANSLPGQFLSNFRLLSLQWRTNFSAVLENRLAFALQVFGMIINDFAWLVMIGLFFSVIGPVNGWTQTEALAIVGLNTFSFSLAFAFLGGTMSLPRLIMSGSFDKLMLRPRNLYLQVISNSFEISALGDLLIGVGLLATYFFLNGTEVIFILLSFIATLFAALTFISVGIVTSSVLFWFPEGDFLAHHLFRSFMRPAWLPFSLFSGAIKFIFIFIIPSLLISGLPLEALKTRSISLIFGLGATSLIWFGFSVWFFYFSVRRYESGNTLGGVS